MYLDRKTLYPLAHHDHHAAGTWVHVEEDLVLWVLWLDMTDQVWRDFAGNCTRWVGLKPTWVLLRPGDTLIMCLGSRNLPCDKLETTVAIGGLF